MWVCCEAVSTQSSNLKCIQTAELTSSPLVPAPCAVPNTLSTLNCSTNTLSIGWVPGSIPMNYSATAVTANNTALQCITQGSSCTIAGLQCGQQYTVRVKPISSTCEGQSSAPEIVNSGVCSAISHRKTMFSLIFTNIFIFFF